MVERGRTCTWWARNSLGVDAAPRYVPSSPSPPHQPHTHTWPVLRFSFPIHNPHSKNTHPHYTGPVDPGRGVLHGTRPGTPRSGPENKRVESAVELGKRPRRKDHQTNYGVVDPRPRELRLPTGLGFPFWEILVGIRTRRLLFASQLRLTNAVKLSRPIMRTRQGKPWKSFFFYHCPI